MRDLLRIILAIVGLIMVVCGQFLTTYLLPTPLDNFNVIFFILILYLIFRESGLVVYLALAAHFAVELYTVTPFGIVLYAGTISFLLGYWLYRSVFTNKSWYSAIILSSIMLVAFRFLYLISGWVGGFVSSQNFWQMIQSFAYEIFFTSLIVGIVVFIGSHWSRRFNPSVLSKQLFRPN